MLSKYYAASPTWPTYDPTRYLWFIIKWQKQITRQFVQHESIKQIVYTLDKKTEEE